MQHVPSVPGHKTRTLWVVLIGLVPSLAVLLVSGSATLARAKLNFLAAQYVLLLPLLLWFAWRERKHRQPVLQHIRTRSWLLPALVLSTLMSGVIGYVLHAGVYSADESTYLFQSRTIAAGNLFVDATGLDRHYLYFEHHILRDGRWFGKYPLGWPLVLAFGALLHVEWLVVPLLGALLMWLTYRISLECFDFTEVQAALLLLLLSPFFTLNNVGFMSHTFCAVLVAAATLFFFLGRRSLQSHWFVWMAFCVAAAILVRPFTAVCVGVVLGFFTLLELRRLGGQALGVVVTGIVLVAGAAAATLWFNQFYTGSYTKSPYAVYRTSSALAEVSVRPADLITGLIKMTPVRIADTAATAFPFLFLLVLYGFWKGRRRREVQVLGALSAILVLGHIVQLEDSSWPFGERYYFEGFFASALLAGYGWRQLIHDRQWSPAFCRSVAVGAIAACIPLWLYFIRLEFTIRIPNARIGEAVEELADTRRLIFLTAGDGYLPRIDNPNRPAWLAKGVLAATDPGPERRKEAAAKLGYDSWSRVAYDASTKQACIVEKNSQ